MDRRRQILQHQQQRFRRHASNCDAYAFFNLLTAPELLQRVESVLPVLIAQKRVGNRPGRIEPRAIKRRPQAYPLLTQSRRSARADVKKNGHAKHVK